MSGRHPDQHPDRDAVTYSLDELTSEADVTARTIRYYIAEGLLPPPLSPGRHARYSQEHLDRLRMIGMMKDRYLPLKEIRHQLGSMSPEQIRRYVSRRSGVLASESRRPPDVSSAQDYVARALEEPAGSYAAAPPRRVRDRRSQDGMDTDLNWRRIPVTDAAELLISEDAWRRRGDQLQPALDWIRRILNE